MRPRTLGALTVLAGALAQPLPAGDLPSPASFRFAFEAQYPKTAATAGALELERLGGAIGVDLVPIPEPRQFGEDGSEVVPASDPRRPRPAPEAAAAFRKFTGALVSYMNTEMKGTDERIGRPSPAVEAFLSEKDEAFAAVESLLLANRDVQWEMDVTRPGANPLPNLLGHLHLHRSLIVRALDEARRGETDAALRTLEASWRLSRSLSMRPEMICHLILVAIAKQEAGALRRIDSPAWEWPDRLRSGDVQAGYLASFANGAWRAPGIQDLTGPAGALGRAYRRIVEGFAAKDSCAWTPDGLREFWRTVMADEFPGEEWAERFAEPNLVESLARFRRFRIDAELTALILDARGERAASRLHRWPEKLTRLGIVVCPGEKWSYRILGNGTARIAFEGKLSEDESPALRLPFEFTAGKPQPVRRGKPALPPAPPSPSATKERKPD